jgi:hypothetical protein
MQEEREEVVATAFLRAIQALEKTLVTLQRTARCAGSLCEAGVARRVDDLAGDVEHSLQGLRTIADQSDTAPRRNGS